MTPSSMRIGGGSSSIRGRPLEFIRALLRNNKGSHFRSFIRRERKATNNRWPLTIRLPVGVVVTHGIVPGIHTRFLYVSYSFIWLLSLLSLTTLFRSGFIAKSMRDAPQYLSGIERGEICSYTGTSLPSLCSFISAAVAAYYYCLCHSHRIARAYFFRPLSHST